MRKDMGAASERETQFFAAGDMATAGLPPTHVAKADDVATAAVNHAGFVFAESNVRYLSRAELENLSADQLHIAHNEILARKHVRLGRGPPADGAARGGENPRST